MKIKKVKGVKKQKNANKNLGEENVGKLHKKSIKACIKTGVACALATAAIVAGSVGVARGVAYKEQSDVIKDKDDIKITEQASESEGDKEGVLEELEVSTGSLTDTNVMESNLENETCNQDEINFGEVSETGVVASLYDIASKVLTQEDFEYETYYRDVTVGMSSFGLYAKQIKDGVEVHLHEETLDVESVMLFTVKDASSGEVEMKVYSQAPFVQYTGNGKGVGYLFAKCIGGQFREFYNCSAVLCDPNENLSDADINNLEAEGIKEFTLVDYSVSNHKKLAITERQNKDGITDEEKVQKTKESIALLNEVKFMDWEGANYTEIDLDASI